MGFAKTIKLWGVYKKTSTVQGFIKEALTVEPDTDTVVLRAVWHAFEVGTERVGEVIGSEKPKPNGSIKRPPAAATVPPMRHRERLDVPKPQAKRGPVRAPAKRGRR